MKFFNRMLFCFLFFLFLINSNVMAIAADGDCSKRGRVTGLFLDAKNGEVYVRLETTTKYVKLKYEMQLPNKDYLYVSLVTKTLLDSFLFYKIVKLECEGNNNNFGSVTTFN